MTLADGNRVGAPPGGSDQRELRNYRPDIDGLRALAVLPIVAFHLGLQRFDGGYVGVDIFFVISGYLVGGPLLTQVGTRRYLVADFYFRRFRRIVPALAVCLIGTTLAVTLISLPAATADYGRSLVSTVLFASNFYFWSTDGYFTASSDAKPLLHTWSLAVEEQFYVLFPLVVLGLRRLGKAALPTGIAVLAAVSLAASVVLLPSSPSATFYLLPTRLWELLLGALVFACPPGLFEDRRRREGACWFGLALILGTILLYRPETPFPGLAAIPPCLGTALLLAAGASRPSHVGKLLSLPPAVWFGLISYSLYLWHWPVIVLMKQALPAASLTLPMKVVASALSIGLAWLSWRFVERPWRNPAVRMKAVMGATLASGALIATLGVALMASGGFPQRYAGEVVRLAAIEDDPGTNDFFRGGTCFISSADRFEDFDPGVCLSEGSGRPNVLLMGDSHAAHLWSGLQRRFPDVNFHQATSSGCMPFVDRPSWAAPRCESMMQFLFDSHLPTRAGGWVILAGRWREHDAADVGKTIGWLRRHGLKVILVGPTVTYDLPLPRLVALAVHRGDPGLVDRFRDKDVARLDRAFGRVAALHGALYMSPYRALCRQGRCRTQDDGGQPLQFDYGHLTAAGSLVVAGEFPRDAVLVQ